VKQKAGSMGSYAGQDVQNVTLHPDIAPHGCQAPEMEMAVGFFWGLFVPSCILFAPSGSFSFVSGAFFFSSALFLSPSANSFPNPVCAC